MQRFDPHLISYWVEGEFPACIWVTSMGTLCGYIGVPASHPWYGQSYDDIEAVCHGGLTYSESETWGHYEEKERAGTSKKYPYETGLGVWWVGFDCAHAGDALPGIESSYEWGVYRDEAYVRSEISNLISQAAKATQCND